MGTEEQAGEQLAEEEAREEEADEAPGVRELPTFEGYTVDHRLEEFRKVEWNDGEPSIEFVKFDSDKGDELLGRYLEEQNRLDQQAEAEHRANVEQEPDFSDEIVVHTDDADGWMDYGSWDDDEDPVDFDKAWSDEQVGIDEIFNDSEDGEDAGEEEDEEADKEDDEEGEPDASRAEAGSECR